MENIEITKADIVMMYTLFVTLVDKGYKVEDLLTEEEKTKLFRVIELNEITDVLETTIMMELFSLLLMKTGIRFATMGEGLIN